jgi:hypothetical protein
MNIIQILGSWFRASFYIVGHITVVELELNHGDVTNHPIMDCF